MSKQFSNNSKIISEIKEQKINDSIGVVFGGEASGLTNDHLSLITKCVTIDTHENFSSLNLSHAVNVFCYSLFSKVFKTEQLVDKNSEPHGSQNDLMYFFDHLEEELESRGFFQPEEKMPKMKQNLRNIFHRADLSEREIATLRGVVTVLTEYRKTKEI
jgi:tRNA/rRNA methyltransferase